MNKYAMILAAGIGQRLRPLTDKKHKALLPIKGLSNIKRLCNNLKEASIKQTFILVRESERENFEKELEEYENVSIHIIEDEKIEGHNNSESLKSLFLSSDIIKILKSEDLTFIIDSDTFLMRNIFKQNYYHSQFLTQYRENEWVIEPHEDFSIKSIKKNSNGYAISGISVWTREDLHALLGSLLANLNTQLFYDDVILNNELLLSRMTYEERDPFMAEYDKIEDLINNDLMTAEEISKFLSDDNKAERLDSMTNDNFLITKDKKEVICRIQGKGNRKSDRHQEILITDFASDSLNISPKSSFNGDVKFTDYLSGYKTLQESDIVHKTKTYKNIFKILKKLHKSKISDLDLSYVDIIEDLKNYKTDSLINIYDPENKTIKDKDKKFFKLVCASIIEIDKVDRVLVHRDLNPLNIMCNVKTSDVKLIDWEYSGIFSRYWDIGSFASEIELSYGINRYEIFNDFKKFYSKSLSIHLMERWSYIVDYVWAKWAETKTEEHFTDVLDYARYRFDKVLEYQRYYNNCNNF